MQWRAKWHGPSQAVKEIAEDADCVEELSVVFGRSLSLLERDVSVHHDSIRESGGVPEQ